MKTGRNRRRYPFRTVPLLVAAGTLILIASCRHQPFSTFNSELLTPVTVNWQDVTGIACDPDTVYFQNTILPLFISNCAKSGCHDASSHKEGLILDSYAHIMATGEIVPFEPNKGHIIKAIQDSDPEDKMPPSGNTPLTSQQIGLIQTWISQGAKNNGCDACDTVNVSYAGKVKPIIDLKCKGCHSGSNPPKGVNLSTFGGTQAVALNGQLTGSLDHAPGYTPMPPGSTLPPCEIVMIQNWVDGGAPNN